MSEIESPAVSRIVNAEIVREHFGYWPNFHDATISRMTFKVHPSSGASITFVIAVCETTDEVEAQGYYKQIKHCDIELQFIGIYEMVFDFDHQPVIFGLDFKVSGPTSGIKCGFASSTGSEVIVAEEVLVLRLTPTNG